VSRPAAGAAVRRLWLVRHAKAARAGEPHADFARPLAKRGVEDAGRIAERLRRHGVRPARLVTSPAARALQTARIVAAALGFPSDGIAVKPRLYLAEPGTILAVVAAEDAAVDSLLLVGHNPGLSELVQRLLPGFAATDLPTAAVVGLELAGAAAWADVATCEARLAYYDFPKNPEEPVTVR
jgi:phosphohistidine phosphatase